MQHWCDATAINSFRSKAFVPEEKRLGFAPQLRTVWGYAHEAPAGARSLAARPGRPAGEACGVSGSHDARLAGI